jgi:hypothetical protein
MKRILSLSVLSSALLVVFLHAQSKHMKGYKPATIVSVEEYVAPSNYVGGSPSHAPLQAGTYSYNVGVRLDCNIYVGCYESGIDYLPSVLAPNHTVDVRLDNHLLYVSLPESDRIVKMGIVSHSRLKQQACPANALISSMSMEIDNGSSEADRFGTALGLTASFFSLAQETGK